MGSLLVLNGSGVSLNKEKVSQLSNNNETPLILLKIERFRRPEKFYNKQFIARKNFISPVVTIA